jgi:hypothetical protein
MQRLEASVLLQHLGYSDDAIRMSTCRKMALVLRTIRTEARRATLSDAMATVAAFAFFGEREKQQEILSMLQRMKGGEDNVVDWQARAEVAEAENAALRERVRLGMHGMQRKTLINAPFCRCASGCMSRDCWSQIRCSAKSSPWRWRV